MENGTLIAAAQWFLRLALAAGFLSAVADRFGLWGPAGAPNGAWGAWHPFVDYVATLNGVAPAASVPILAWISTVAEVVLAIGLLIGWQLRWFALAAGLLLLSFSLIITFALGVEAPPGFLVFARA